MIKKLTKHGNSQALILDKSVLEALGLQPESLLQLTISGNRLTITPANVGVGPERMKELIHELRPEYEGMLRELAK